MTENTAHTEKRGPGKRGPDKQPRAPRGSKGKFVHHPASAPPKADNREPGHRREFEETFRDLDVSIPFYIPEPKKADPPPPEPPPPHKGDPPPPRDGEINEKGEVWNEAKKAWENVKTEEIPFEPNETEILRAMRKVELLTTPLAHIYCKITNRRFNYEAYKWTDAELLEYAPAAKKAINLITKVITDPKYFYFGFPINVIKKAHDSSMPIEDENSHE